MDGFFRAVVMISRVFQGSSIMNGVGNNYKCISNATVSPAHNGAGTALNGNTLPPEVSCTVVL